ncbi:MAG TPA: HAMP domain-containing sensor histidine kinase [Xanthomonadales bacterium]|nr:HAMP domain-containing sensor histidine kinase [Xanthomonadales bacterium]
MQYRRRLRSRIIISFLLFGVGLTALFAGITLVMREWLEEELIETKLQEEVDNAVELNRRNPRLGMGIPFSGITGDIVARHRFAEIPFARQFETGVYDISEKDEKTGEMRDFKLAVRKADDFWAFMQYDITEQRRTRSVLMGALILVVVGFAGLSLIIAFWLSRRVLAPVTDLAERVQRFERESDPLAPHYADDEVGRLAAALDDYALRLTSLVQRDREFNADVSHELRTPLAVIRGATELLLAQEGLPEKTRERIKRIDRAARQSHELTEALLLLSRSERPASESSDVTVVVDQVVEAQRTNLGTKPVEVRVEKDAAPKVAAPASVLAVALSNLIGNAFRYTAEGSVTVRIEPGRVVVEDTGPGIDPSEAGKLFERGYRGHGAPGKGAGLGLAIVRRLCDLYGWRVTLAPRVPRGAIATLEFAS